MCNRPINRQATGYDRTEDSLRQPATIVGRSQGLLCRTVVCCLLVVITSVASAAPTDEELLKIKAAFLLNFVKFIVWPEEAFASPDSPMVIGVLGDGAFSEVVAKTVHGVRLDGRTLQVHSFAFPSLDDLNETKRQRALDRFRQQLGRCHLVFLASNHLDHTRAIHDLSPLRHIVLVSDGKLGAHRGAMLALEREGDRVVFYGNPAVVEASAVKVSSKLLQLARPVESGD